jgi:DnaJ like chaperone protein
MACEQIKTLATHDSKYEMIKLLYTIAAVDGFLTSLENKTIQKIGKYLSLPESEVLEIRDKIVRANSPFGLLEIDETRSVEKVKAAYRKMVLKYHPDKRSKTTSEEDANRKFREIKRAYELILQKLED